MVVVSVVLGLILAFGILLWIADIGTDFLERMKRSRSERPFNQETDV